MFNKRLLVKLFLTMILLTVFVAKNAIVSFASELAGEEQALEEQFDEEESIGIIVVEGEEIDLLNLAEEEIDKPEDDVDVLEEDEIDIEEVEEENIEDKKKTNSNKSKTTKKTIEKKKANKASYTKQDLRLLSSLIYAEAGGELYQGKLAVANTVLNRVKSSSYSHVNTIKQVVYDRKWAVQYAVIIKSKRLGTSPLERALILYDTGKYPGRNSEAENRAMKQCIKAAKAALEGENNIGSFLSFNALNGSTSRIKSKYPNYKIIGGQIYYRTR